MATSRVTLTRVTASQWKSTAALTPVRIFTQKVKNSSTSTEVVIFKRNLRARDYLHLKTTFSEEFKKMLEVYKECVSRGTKIKFIFHRSQQLD